MNWFSIFLEITKIKVKLLKPIFLGTTVTLIFLFFVLLDVFNLGSLGRNASLDILTNLYPYESLYPENSKKLVFVNIDDATIAEFGQWPWPRQLTAKLINKIGAKKPAVIGLDILITEKDRFALDNLAKTLNVPKNSLSSLGVQDGDIVLGKSVKDNPVTTAFVLTDQEIKSNQKSTCRI